jgi:hypothetical protein
MKLLIRGVGGLLDTFCVSGVHALSWMVLVVEAASELCAVAGNRVVLKPTLKLVMAMQHEQGHAAEGAG